MLTALLLHHPKVEEDSMPHATQARDEAGVSLSQGLPAPTTSISGARGCFCFYLRCYTLEPLWCYQYQHYGHTMKTSHHAWNPPCLEHLNCVQQGQEFQAYWVHNQQLQCPWEPLSGDPNISLVFNQKEHGTTSYSSFREAQQEGSPNTDRATAGTGLAATTTPAKDRANFTICLYRWTVIPVCLHPRKHVLIAGDFNSHQSWLGSLSPSNMASRALFLSFEDSGHVIFLNDMNCLTHNHLGRLDLAFALTDLTPTPSWSLHPTLTSDHFGILINIEMRLPLHLRHHSVSTCPVWTGGTSQRLPRISLWQSTSPSGSMNVQNSSLQSFSSSSPGDLHPHLFTYQQRKRTTTCLLTLLGALCSRSGMVIFLDLEKAFELADPSAMFEALVEKGMKSFLILSCLIVAVHTAGLCDCGAFVSLPDSELEVMAFPSREMEDCRDVLWCLDFCKFEWEVLTLDGDLCIHTANGTVGQVMCDNLSDKNMNHLEPRFVHLFARMCNGPWGFDSQTSKQKLECRGGKMTTILDFMPEAECSFRKEISAYLLAVNNAIESYFPKLDDRCADAWISRSFSVQDSAINDIGVAAKLPTFWAKLKDKCPHFSVRSLTMLIQSPTSYFCEAGFSAVMALITKTHSRLVIDADMRILPDTRDNAGTVGNPSGTLRYTRSLSLRDLRG
ncbi:hypothetical protein O3P69_014635 [Scylla paramamosain]|uniref:Endonuclease/exonuclease/phosphatase domain-containing protein n=1 Tax=Scylla paramamosain TaxID=85552 RepID=A0AAW0TXE5_SCYPA